jgi:hypothetical protein
MHFVQILCSPGKGSSRHHAGYGFSGPGFAWCPAEKEPIILFYKQVKIATFALL